MKIPAVKHDVHKTLTLRPHVTVRKVACRIKRAASETLMRRHDKKSSSHPNEFPFGKLFSFFPSLSVTNLVPYFETISCVIKHYLDHRFDLLGSGWVQVKHGMQCRGLEGYRYDMGDPVDADSGGKWLEDRINSSNLRESQRIWRLVDLDYTPIDWHIDFKSGYRWSEDRWYKDIKYVHKLGVDIKVPWELARMQYLAQMAICYAIGTQSSKLKGENNAENIEEGLENKKPRDNKLKNVKNYPREFRNQVLDFIATNPPRFGVNWVCAMDVAIRVSNWLMAYDIFMAAGVTFDEPFEAVFSRSVFEHGLHIMGNLEWQNGHRGNHYLAEIVGLAYIAVHLESNREMDAWMAFSVQELITEVGHQFYPDGGNFEGSTAYHRLSTEMVYYATALVVGLPYEKRQALKQYDHKALKTVQGKPKLKPAPLPFYKLPEGSVSHYDESPFPLWYFERMELMAEFILDITKPNGHIPQIGDNDNGRFFKLSPKYRVIAVKRAKELYANLDDSDDLADDSDYYLENHLDCSHAIASASGLFNSSSFDGWSIRNGIVESLPDAVIIGWLARGTVVGSHRHRNRKSKEIAFCSIGDKDYGQNAIEMNEHKKHTKNMYVNQYKCIEGDLTQDITIQAYPCFGLYLYKSPRLYLAIRCWGGSEPYHSVHMHHDQLSFELVIDGIEKVLDPGTYLYSPLPAMRERYRSANAHFVPVNDQNEGDCLQEPNAFSPLFLPRAQVKIFQPDCFLAIMSKNFIAREILIRPKDILILDFPAEMKLQQRKQNCSLAFSPAYGWQARHIRRQDALYDCV